MCYFTKLNDMRCGGPQDKVKVGSGEPDPPMPYSSVLFPPLPWSAREEKIKCKSTGYVASSAKTASGCRGLVKRSSSWRVFHKSSRQLLKDMKSLLIISNPVFYTP